MTAPCICPENGRVADCPIDRHREQYDALGWPHRICQRYQEVRGDRLVFSCDCNGDCPYARPRPSPAVVRGDRHQEREAR